MIKMGEDLIEWVQQNQEKLEFVKEYGRTSTLQAQAKALLKIAPKSGEQDENKRGEES